MWQIISKSPNNGADSNSKRLQILTVIDLVKVKRIITFNKKTLIILLL